MDTPYVFEWVDETTSTQDTAHSRYAGRPTVVAAARQTAGRGRRGRVWESAPRALAISVCWAPGWNPTAFGLLPLVAGLAATDVIDGLLKWPNDVVDVNRNKLAGILSESVGPVVTVGLGINLYWPDPPSGFGSLFAADPGPRPDLAEQFASRLLSRSQSGGDAWGRAEYEDRCVTIGQTIRWEPGGQGRAVAVGEGGELVVETDSGRRSLVTGEVWDVRAAGSGE